MDINDFKVFVFDFIKELSVSLLVAIIITGIEPIIYSIKKRKFIQENCFQDTFKLIGLYFIYVVIGAIILPGHIVFLYSMGAANTHWTNLLIIFNIAYIIFYLKRRFIDKKYEKHLLLEINVLSCSLIIVGYLCKYFFYASLSNIMDYFFYGNGFFVWSKFYILGMSGTFLLYCYTFCYFFNRIDFVRSRLIFYRQRKIVIYVLDLPFILFTIFYMSIVDGIFSLKHPPSFIIVTAILLSIAVSTYFFRPLYKKGTDTYNDIYLKNGQVFYHILSGNFTFKDTLLMIKKDNIYYFEKKEELLNIVEYDEVKYKLTNRYVYLIRTIAIFVGEFIVLTILINS